MHRGVGGALEIEGWMEPVELEWLYETARSLPDDAAVVEVGSWKGRSTVAICEGLAPGSRLWAVDTFKGDPDVWEAIGPTHVDVLPEFGRNTAGHPCLSTVVATSIEAAAGFERASLDWVFIDADHSYYAVLADILAWAPKVKPGGLTSGHDFPHPGVSRAVQCAFGTTARGPAGIWYTRARPRHRAAITARERLHPLRLRARRVFRSQTGRV